MAESSSSPTITAHLDRVRGTVDPNVYGHFIEHLSTDIYDGIWVGPDSDIPNEDGIRRDTVEALAAIHPPLIRWPGGYFADLYDWRDGTGPRESRPTRVCPTEPNREESNQFGTAEFMRLCEMTGAEPFLCVNTSFMKANEAGHWVEYCNLDGNTYWTQKRREHGHPKPWNVRYWAIGNESYWMHSPGEYLQRYRLWKHFMRNADPSIIIVSSGLEPNWRPDPWGRDDWGTWFIKETRADMDQYSIHTYFSSGGGATFCAEEYYNLFVQLYRRLPRSIRASIGLLDAHSAFPREVKVAVDEWGIWHPGHPMGSDMRQPNTLRDALFAAGFFHICQDFPDRVAMATVAQTVNVGQALIHTEGARMVRTPTYHVFDMYQSHMGGRALEVAVSGVQRVTRAEAGIENEDFGPGGQGGQPGRRNQVPLAPEGKMMPPMLWATATLQPDRQGATLSVINLSLDDDISAEIQLSGAQAETFRTEGALLTTPDVRVQNSYDEPDRIVPSPVSKGTHGKAFSHTFPRHSLTVLHLAW